MILFCLLRERVIEVSGGFLYFVRSRARKVVTTLALEGAQDTSPQKVTSWSRCPPRYGKYSARGTKAGRWCRKNGRRRSTEEEKGEGDGEEEQFPDRGSEKLGMQFSLVLRAWGHLTPGCRSR